MSPGARSDTHIPIPRRGGLLNVRLRRKREEDWLRHRRWPWLVLALTAASAVWAMPELAVPCGTAFTVLSVRQATSCRHLRQGSKRPDNLEEEST
jgi:hypothetical protein